MQDSGSVARNFLALGSGEMVSRIIAFGVTVYLARILGAEGYGVIAFAAGITLYLSKVADFAIEAVGTKEIAIAPDSVNHLASAVMCIRLLIAGLLTGVAVLGAQLLMHRPESTILSLYFLTLIPIAASTKWVHLGLENARPIGLSRIAGETLALCIILCLVRSHAELWVAPLALVAGDLFIAFLLIMVLRQRNYKFGIRWDPATAIPIFVKAAPLLSQIMLGLFIYNADLIFLRLFCNSESVGYYAAAYTLISLISNLGVTYGMTLLPTLTRLGAKTVGEKMLYHTSLAHVYAVCFPLTVGGCLLASQIIKLGFGSGYANSGFALQVLVWSIPLSVFRNVPWAALITRGHQNLLLKATIYAVIGNIILNIILIPMYGIIGAAIATVITECLAGVLMLRYAAAHELPFASLTRFWRPTIAGLLMGTALIVIKPSYLVVSLVLGISTYVSALFVFGGIRIQKGQLPVLNV